MKITINNSAKGKIVEVNGFLNKKNVSILSDTLQSLIEQNTPGIILDLKDLSYMDSAGISVFIACKKDIESRGGRMALLQPNKNVLFLLQLVALDDFFSIINNEEEFV
jgi:anti-sigma B factor antagonist